jgi:hypothetical protein
MQADAEILRDRLGAQPGENAATDLLLARGQIAERRPRREQRGDVLFGTGRCCLDMARDGARRLRGSASRR